MTARDFPPPIGPRGLAIRCAIQGREAFDRGAPVLACPYGPSRPFSRRAWVTGYTAAEIASGARQLDEIGDVDDNAPAPTVDKR